MPRKKPAKPDKPHAISGKQRLDYAKALKKAAKGATHANIALAAGSKAKGRNNLASVGRRIVAVLKTRGDILETFDKLGYDVQRFASQVIEQTEARKVTRIKLGDEIEEFDDIDWGARCAARSQYMAAVGITDLDPTANDAGASMLGDLSNDDIARAIEEITRGDAPPPAAG